MIRFDQVLLDPSAEQLDGCLRRAVEATDSPLWTIPGAGPLDELADGVARLAREPEGED